MKISKQSWHYRFNNYVQDGFASRVRHDTFTTCTYVRTTIASLFTGLFKLLTLLIMLGVTVAFICSGIYLPVALGFGLPIAEPFNVFGVVFWIGFVAGVGVYVHERYFKEKLAVRRERKLDLLRQAMADKKAGVCTIVEFE